MTTPGSAPTQEKRAVIASMIGTTIEYYDFFIYGTAAGLVFGDLFFPNTSPAVGTLLSLSTFAIAFIMRPIGAVVFGHFGDRIGRKQMLFVTLTLMGAGTVAIGLLPTYHQVGLLAPLLLVLARMVQGFSLGGELAGGMLMSIESGRTSRRGLMGALVNSGAGWGLLLANASFLLLTQLPDDQFAAWGWRVPFLASGVLVVVGIYIRLKLSESPDFAQVKKSDGVRKLPIVEAFRTSTKPILLIAVGLLASGVNFYIASVYSLTYGQEVLGKSNGTMLSLIMCMTVLIIVLTPLFGLLSDRVGRKPVFVVSAAGLVVAPFAWFALLQTAHFGWMLLGFSLMFVGYCANIAATPTFFALAFPPAVRYSAMAIGWTLGAIAGASVAPMIAAWVQQQSGGWIGIAVYMSVASVLTVIASSFLRERTSTTAPAAQPEPEADSVSVPSGVGTGRQVDTIPQPSLRSEHE